MASQYPPHCYDEQDLSVLETVLTDVWVTLRVHDPFHEWEKASELRVVLAEKVMTLADMGVTDPDELRQKVLENLS
jgi:hypothetical protein